MILEWVDYFSFVNNQFYCLKLSYYSLKLNMKEYKRN